MSDIKQELDKIRGRISEPSFLKNEGLSNEVGIHVFCYDPADELIVTMWNPEKRGVEICSADMR